MRFPRLFKAWSYVGFNLLGTKGDQDNFIQRAKEQNLRSCKLSAKSKTDKFSNINPLRPNNDLSQTAHCNIKVLSVSEVMRIENMITQVQFY